MQVTPTVDNAIEQIVNGIKALQAEEQTTTYLMKATNRKGDSVMVNLTEIFEISFDQITREVIRLKYELDS